MRIKVFYGVAFVLAIQALVSSKAIAEPITRQELVGRWKGLRTMPGIPTPQIEILVFSPDGSYASEQPTRYKSRYRIDGDKVILADHRTLTYKGGGLSGAMTVYIKVIP